MDGYPIIELDIYETNERKEKYIFYPIRLHDIIEMEERRENIINIMLLLLRDGLLTTAALVFDRI